MSATVPIDEWITEAEERRAKASPAGQLFFELPDPREASPEDRAVDDTLIAERARWRRNQKAMRDRRRVVMPPA